MEKELLGYAEYKKMVTIDNIRRTLSSFFAWLEKEDYIVKSPVRRIHKVKATKKVKEKFILVQKVEYKK